MLMDYVAPSLTPLEIATTQTPEQSILVVLGPYAIALAAFLAIIANVLISAWSRKQERELKHQEYLQPQVILLFDELQNIRNWKSEFTDYQIKDAREEINNSPKHPKYDEFPKLITTAKVYFDKELVDLIAKINKDCYIKLTTLYQTSIADLKTEYGFQSYDNFKSRNALNIMNWRYELEEDPSNTRSVNPRCLMTYFEEKLKELESYLERESNKLMLKNTKK